MSLNELLSAMKQDFVAKADPEVLKVMGNARQKLVDSGLHEKALGKGENLPKFTLKDSEGNEFSSSEALKKGPLLISWYRGIWRPYCNAELEALQKIAADIKDSGATIVAISPMQQKYARNLIKNLGLSFPLLLDPDNQLAKQFRMVFKLPDDLKAMFGPVLAHRVALDPAEELEGVRASDVLARILDEVEVPR